MQNLYFQNEEFDTLDDNKLIQKIKNGDKKALNYLLEKYTEVVSMKAGKYFIVGAEKEDIIQEGLIGLFKAIKSFDPEKQSSFKTFANLTFILPKLYSSAPGNEGFIAKTKPLDISAWRYAS